jgi:hypothetical protein
MIFSFVDKLIRKSSWRSRQFRELGAGTGCGNWLDDIPMLHEPAIPDAKDVALRIRAFGNDPAQIFAQAMDRSSIVGLCCR